MSRQTDHRTGPSHPSRVRLAHCLVAGVLLSGGGPRAARAASPTGVELADAVAVVVTPPQGWRRAGRSPYPSTVLEYRFGTTARSSLSVDQLGAGGSLERIAQQSRDALVASGFRKPTLQRITEMNVAAVALELLAPEGRRRLEQRYFAHDGNLYVVTLVSDDGAPAAVATLLPKLTRATLEVLLPSAPEEPSVTVPPSAAPTSAAPSLAPRAAPPGDDASPAP